MTPIKDYALIGNCETAALINPNGGIDWLCVPAFDAAAIFNRLLDHEKGGDFALNPIGHFDVERRYVDDSAIFETRFSTKTGVVRLTDFFVIARKPNARFYDFTSLHDTSKLVRLIEWESGAPVEMELRVSARPDYARKPAHWKQQSATAFAIDEATLFTNVPMTEARGDLKARFRVERDRPFFAVLDYTDGRPLPDIEQVRRWLRVTAAFWREWNLFNYYRGPHEKMVRRSAVTLKLLTYSRTGGFVAAPTTSLPEQPGGDANWDYRFTWLRDTALFIQTLFGLGYSGEAKAFVDFATREWMEGSEKNRENNDAPTIAVMYPVCDAPIPPEATLDHLDGYGGAKPVRMGNAAKDQFQLDNYGHVLQSLFFFRHTGGKIDADKRKMLVRLTDEAVRFWREEDNGIWEERQTSQYTYGKIMCWVALQRARELLSDKNGELAKACAEIRREVLDRGLLEIGGRKVLSAKLDEAAMDASTLLAFTTGFLDEHVAALTREGLEQKLARGPLLYRGEEKVGEEGAFIMCSFWWINHLIREGQLARAEGLLEAMIALASPLGLYSEEMDPETGAFLGNFPQAFSHLGFIQSVLNLEGAKKKRGFFALPDHEKFQRSVGATIGWKGVIAGFFRVPKTAVLFFSKESKWRS
ncbi:MAG: glycoside hydrolase family 15 protein [Chthoniobacterales bacterium]|nr:glycoside hydrolase family 15 protein [Chthoniobacterales bacterium]